MVWVAVQSNFDPPIFRKLSHKEHYFSVFAAIPLENIEFLCRFMSINKDGGLIQVHEIVRFFEGADKLMANFDVWGVVDREEVGRILLEKCRFLNLLIHYYYNSQGCSLKCEADSCSPTLTNEDLTTTKYLTSSNVRTAILWIYPSSIPKRSVQPNIKN